MLSPKKTHPGHRRVTPGPREIVEVSVAWGGDVLGLVSLGKRAELFVGETAGRGQYCDLFLPAEVLGSRRHQLLQVDARGAVHLCPPSMARGWVRYSNEMQVDLASLQVASPNTKPPEASAEGWATPSQFPLKRGSRALLVMGDFTVSVRLVGIAERQADGDGAEEWHALLSYWGLSAALFCGLAASLAYAVPPLGLAPEQGVDKEKLLLLRQYMASSALREVELERSPADAGSQNPLRTTANPNSNASGESKAGAAGLAHASKRLHQRQPTDRQREQVNASEDERAHQLSSAKSFGINGLLQASPLGQLGIPAAPWDAGPTGALQATGANAEMWADSLDQRIGNGLTVQGGGEGGGLRGTWVGLFPGDLGGGSLLPLVDGGGGSRRVSGGSGRFGDGMALSRNHHRTNVPRIRQEATTTSGRLPADAVQRVMRQNFGRFRMCYQAGLNRDPSLEGRVTLRFVINSEGVVSNVVGDGSGLRDAAVNDCLRTSLYAITFPSPETGVVTVQYPLLFSSE